LSNLPKGRFRFISGGENLPGLKSILEKLLDFYKKLFFFAAAYLYFHTVTHDNGATLAPHILLYVHQVNEKRFMYPEKNSVG